MAVITVIVKLFMLPLLLPSACARNISLRCWEDVGEFLSDLNVANPKPYAIKMYDSAGKPSSNVLSGNMDRLGSYSECTSAEAPSGRFQGQYCKLQLEQGGIDYYNGICVPDSCHEEEITTLAIEDVFKFKTISFLLPFPSPFALNSTVSLTTVARCAKDLFSIDAFVAVCFFLSISFIILPIIGTIYTAYVWRRAERDEFPSGSLSSTNYGSTSSVENEVGKSKGEKKSSHYGAVSAWLIVVDGPRQTFLESLDCILKSFSLQKTLSAFRQVKPSRDVSLVLNGIRALSLLWVISGHTSQMTAWQNLDNTLEWEAKVLKNPIYIYSCSGPFYLSVDTFFLISGMLSSQSFLNMLNHSGKEVTCSIALKYVGNRFLRLQPLHLYSVCLLVGLYSVVPWGALWEPAQLQVENCRILWGANLLLINNFFPGSESCNGWTWYLANDFQFCFTTPLLVLSYSRSKHGLMVTGAVLFLGTFTVTALLSSFYQLPVANPEDMSEDSEKDMKTKRDDSHSADEDFGSEDDLGADDGKADSDYESSQKNKKGKKAKPEKNKRATSKSRKRAAEDSEDEREDHKNVRQQRQAASKAASKQREMLMDDVGSEEEDQEEEEASFQEKDSGSDEDFLVEDDDDSDYGSSKKKNKKVAKKSKPERKEKKMPKPRLKATVTPSPVKGKGKGGRPTASKASKEKAPSPKDDDEEPESPPEKKKSVSPPPDKSGDEGSEDEVPSGED